jgi:hypothetical protein
MALRRLALAITILSPAASNALAERHLFTNPCAYVMSLSDVGDGELEGFAATNLGGGVDSYRGAGLTARLHFEHGIYALMEGRMIDPVRRLATPVPVTQPRRKGGMMFGIGATPIRGKATDGMHVYYFDVVAGAGAGIAFVRGPDDDHATGHLAFGGEVALRVRLARGVSIDLGLAYEGIPYPGTARSAARVISPSLALPPDRHEIEVRFGVAGWLPDTPGHRCVVRCAPR